MDADAGLLINAVVSGLLLGGFYAAVSVGVAISFGMLDIVNIAHPAFILLGSYAAFIGNTVFGIDPILAAAIMMPAFYLLGMAMVGGLQIFLSRTFIGRAIQAVAQDQQALRLMAADPVKIKRIAFGLSFATAALGGAAMIIIQPIEPSLGREYIGRIFAICVLGGLGSFPGMVLAAITLGVVENITATFFGPSWAPAVSFGVLLITLAVRPSGILGR
jgi:branched-subunit amino acid ABC-type transport system permease component